jgi:hypothetical protein
LIQSIAERSPEQAFGGAVGSSRATEPAVDSQYAASERLRACASDLDRATGSCGLATVWRSVSCRIPP